MVLWLAAGRSAAASLPDGLQLRHRAACQRTGRTPRLGSIEVDAHGDHWLHVVGKGSKAGKVALPGLARAALDRHLVQRGLPMTPAMWNPARRCSAASTARPASPPSGCGHREAVLRDSGRRSAGHEPRAGRETPAGNTALDAPHARDACASARRRADDGARQPAARVAVDDVDVPALGRSSPGEADRWGV